ncbi:hypothetical protein NPX13_g1051 [Xylaria arbuscula]|uniref:cyclin-dependent kinase n=1 Tax=Xylaria arbuscula TaxID=114810 RepID=A0A9W8NMU6_9PEZI|nr:hypothetical protein NPX13_g1051 [Xylaria arbuscula]
MTSNSDWRATLTSTSRYDTIQAMSAFTTSPMLVVFRCSSSTLEKMRFDDYETACQVKPTLQHSIPLEVSAETQGPTDTLNSTSVTIGAYPDCQYIGDGVTAEVYKSGAVALKVIVQTRNIEPHDQFREAKILKLLKRPCIPLLETFRDQEQRFVLVFPYMPMSLEGLVTRGPITRSRIVSHFRDLLTALQYLHDQGIIHRDVKPSAVLLESPDGPAYLSDFGTAWHPELSAYTEPVNDKVLDIGTGPYRSPEALFGDKAYDAGVDMWAAGAMLAECCRVRPKPLFESRPAHEDGNQLGLILSIFKTIGSPTREAWPEAMSFKTPPFDMYRTFEGQRWEDLLPDVEDGFRDIIMSLVRYSSNSRMSASQVLKHECLSVPKIA